MELKYWIHEPTRQGGTVEIKGRTPCTDDHPLRHIAADDKTANHDIIDGKDVSAGRDITQARRRSSRVHVVNFNDRDTRRVVRAAHNGGVVASIERRN